MKIFLKSILVLVCLVTFVSGCSTTPNLDKNFGKATKQSLSAQQIPSSSSGDSLVQAKEIKSAYDGYIKAGSGSSSEGSNTQGSMQSR
jgi:PBP1b-binding outer membrane lipoprotein LpoB